MPSPTLKYGVVIAVLLAITYQLLLKTILFVIIGLGREILPLSNFPHYECRRIIDSRLEACEDLWLSENTRQLFLACSESRGRKEWNPAIGRLNASGRSLNDAVIAMDIDKPKGGSFEYRVLKTTAFGGGDGRLNLVGFTGREGSGNIELALVNMRPPMDETTGELQDASVVGVDPTIELFETGAQAKELRHVKTVQDGNINTPNNVAFSSSGFYITNDHGSVKTGWKHSIAPLVGIGDVTYCGAEGCKVVSKGHKFPNGLMMGQDNRLYVPSAFEGGITVYKPNANNDLEKVDYIDIPYPIDNLSQDSEGNIWAPAFPKATDLEAAFEDPFNKGLPATMFRIDRHNGEWRVDKVLEDGKAEVLPLTTGVIHDVKTGRLFMSSACSPFIAVCEPRDVRVGEF